MRRTRDACGRTLCPALLRFQLCDSLPVARARGTGSGAVSVSIPRLLDDSMAAGKAASKPSLWQNERLRFIVCFCGVFVCYFYYGILQETITRGDYSHAGKKEKFRYATTLVFIQCIINAAFARFLIQVFESSKQDHTRSWLYGLCSLSYLGAMVSSNSALQYVNYPTQVLGKSCKPIPVMILGVTILRKKYPMAKYLCVFLIVTGVALFLYKPNKGSSTSDEHTYGFGEMLLLLSLTLDGLTGVAQDHMRVRFQTGANHMMLNINMWSTLVLGISELKKRGLLNYRSTGTSLVKILVIKDKRIHVYLLNVRTEDILILLTL
uniref:Solute carrier family 35 member B1 n=1 Tax=Cyprinus carpio TaxID=7962 RepID=A0A8C1U752_CYPCA